eukprot:CAMPEP_0197859712 /NCGR_PEP_ID=MMETSP1438-20131217/34520_1 /TAXON_ID=1461541 /ORGANISM="Pterosperma sp., Strain CCMP1384" /LENGTH=248 /DNA_ID=CAMNT_0043476317 /DNA_START=153 /DNA_END=899 /DNA_ORIENTATION=+
MLHQVCGTQGLALPRPSTSLRVRKAQLRQTVLYPQARLVKSVSRCSRLRRTGTLQIRATDADPDRPDSEDSDPAAASFAEELKRRGIQKEKEMEQSSANQSKVSNPFEQMLNKAKESVEPPEFYKNLRENNDTEWKAPAKEEMDNQLEKSRLLNSEGIEGFPTRAGELLKLGGSFFLAFGPFIGGVVILFLVVYFALGSDFIHGGSYYQEPFVTPEELLLAPTVDPMVPFSQYSELDADPTSTGNVDY